MLQIRSRELGFLGVHRGVHGGLSGVLFVGVACSASEPPALQDVGVDEKEPSGSESSEGAANPEDFLGEETIEIPAVCGDGLLAGESEFCDDGNNDDGRRSFATTVSMTVPTADAVWIAPAVPGVVTALSTPWSRATTG